MNFNGKIYNSLTRVSLFLILIVQLSCEDVIELEIDSANQRLVINAQISDKTNPEVMINKSTNFFDPISNPPISKAEVNISDELGNKWILQESIDKPGCYINNNFKAKPGLFYHLDVKAENEIITAKAFMPKPVELDSISVLIEKDIFSDSLLPKLHAYWVDPKGTDNYYRIMLYYDDELQTGIYLFDSKVSDGASIDYTSFPKLDQKELPNKISVHLWCISKEVFLYYKTLEEALTDGASSSSAPYNPETNLLGNALGVFAPHSCSHTEILVKGMP
ncbi:MAG: DUF4249 domain-containing protein [Hyphomicrobiales bacterium]